MKKYFLILLFCLLILFFNVNYVYAKDISHQKFNPNIEQRKPTIYEECQSCSLENKPEKNSDIVQPMSLCATKDVYEDNNSLRTSTKIYRFSSIFATLHKQPWYCGGYKDEDYYYFNTDRRLQLTINLENIPSGTDYDIELYDENEEYVIGSFSSSNNPERISRIVHPGTYYIFIYSYNGYNNDSPYRLSLTDSTINDNTINLLDPSIKQNYKAVMWESEYFPMGMTPLINEPQMLIYKENGTVSGYQTPYPRLIDEVGTDREYISRILYIWGKNEKEVLAQDIRKAIQLLEYCDPNDSAQFTFSIISTGYGLASVLWPSNIPLGVISLVTGLISMVIPDGSVMPIVYYSAWLGYLVGFLESSPEGEVIKLTEYYNIVKNYNVVDRGYEWYVHYYVKCDSTLSAPVYTSSFINAYQTNNPFYGRLRKISITGQINDLFL